MRKYILVLACLLLSLPAMAQESSLYVRKVHALTKGDSSKKIVIEVQVVNRGQQAADATLVVHLKPKSPAEAVREKYPTCEAWDASELTEEITGLAPGASKVITLATPYKANSKFDTAGVEFEAASPVAGLSAPLKVKYQVTLNP